jgi:hypothetical protein
MINAIYMVIKFFVVIGIIALIIEGMINGFKS